MHDLSHAKKAKNQQGEIYPIRSVVFRKKDEDGKRF